MKVQNQKTSNYKDKIQKENFTGGKTGNDLYYKGKTLLTLYYSSCLHEHSLVGRDVTLYMYELGFKR